MNPRPPHLHNPRSQASQYITPRNTSADMPSSHTSFISDSSLIAGRGLPAIVIQNMQVRNVATEPYLGFGQYDPMSPVDPNDILPVIWVPSDQSPSKHAAEPTTHDPIASTSAAPPLKAPATLSHIKITESDVSDSDSVNVSSSSDTDWPFQAGKHTQAGVQQAHTTSPEHRRIYECTICKMTYSTKTGMDQHVIREHTVGKQHKCPQCDTAFKLKGDLTAHRKQIHGRNKFLCPLCGHRSKMKKYFNSHMKNKHPGIHLNPIVIDDPAT